MAAGDGEGAIGDGFDLQGAEAAGADLGGVVHGWSRGAGWTGGHGCGGEDQCVVLEDVG